MRTRIVPLSEILGVPSIVRLDEIDVGNVGEVTVPLARSTIMYDPVEPDGDWEDARIS